MKDNSAILRWTISVFAAFAVLLSAGSGCAFAEPGWTAEADRPGAWVGVIAADDASNQTEVSPGPAAVWVDRRVERAAVAASDSAGLGGTAAHFEPAATHAPSAAAPPQDDTEPRPLITIWHLFLVVLSLLWLLLFFGLGWHRLNRAPERPHAFSAPAGLLLLAGVIIVPVAGILAARVIFGIDITQPLGLREASILRVGQYAAEAIIIVAFFVLVWRASRPKPDRRFGIPASALVGAGGLVMFWTFVLVVSWVIALVMELARGVTPDPIAHETLAQMIEAERDVWFFLMIGMVILIAPIFEEVIYRGILQELLGRLDMPRWIAIFGASAIFTLRHWGAAPTPEAAAPMLASLFVLSLGFGWAYEKTGRLAAPIVMHMLFNAGNLAAATWLA